MVREHGGRVTCGTLETRGEQFLRQVPADAAQTLSAGPRFRAFLSYLEESRGDSEISVRVTTSWPSSTWIQAGTKTLGRACGGLIDRCKSPRLLSTGFVLGSTALLPPRGYSIFVHADSLRSARAGVRGAGGCNFSFRWLRRFPGD